MPDALAFARASVRSHTVCGEASCHLEHASRRLCERPGVLDYWRAPPLMVASVSGKCSLRAERRRRVDDSRSADSVGRLDGAAAPVAAVLRLEPAMRPAGALRSGYRPADSMPAREIASPRCHLRIPLLAHRLLSAPARPCWSTSISRFPRIVARHRGTEWRRQDDDRKLLCRIV